MPGSATAKLISQPLSIVYRVWCKTLRITYENAELVRRSSKGGDRFAWAVWHDELFIHPYAHRHIKFLAIVSQSKDGEIVAGLLKRLGFDSVRGSSHRGGVRALVGAYSRMKKHDLDVAVAVDGPKGPRHKVKDGIIYLAVKADARIVPVRAVFERRKVFEKAWDRFQLPLPFSKCRIIYGEPYRADPDLSPESVARQVKILEEKLDALAPSSGT